MTEKVTEIYCDNIRREILLKKFSDLKERRKSITDQFKLGEERKKKRLDEKRLKKNNTKIIDESLPITTNAIKSINSITRSSSCSNQTTNDFNCRNEVNSLSWLGIKPFLNVNEHLTQTTGSNQNFKYGLEKQMENALIKQDAETALKISDRLSFRDFGMKIADAFEAKKFIDKKQMEKDLKKMKKKKQIAWGFQPKHRWETKGNM